MNSWVYVAFIVRQHRGFMVCSMIIVAALQSLIISLISGVDTAAFMTDLLQQLPERFQMFISEAFLARLSVPGAAAFGFAHPIVLVLLVISAISFPTRHIAGEIESGTMEWLLSHPVPRGRLALVLWASGALVVLLTVASACAGSLTALAVKGKLDAALLAKMLRIGVNLWLLMVLIMSYTMVVAVFSKDGSNTGSVTAGVTLVFYFLHILSTLFDSFSFVRAVNIFTYHQPQKLMFGGQSFALNAVVLGMLIGVCLGIAMKQFQRRDIPG
ncbi:MAG: ABC transporter permease subunit [Candidatus Krumholzibacteriia bacterium]